MIDLIPLHSIVGGAVIGLSAVVLLLFKGRVAGISGILNGMFTRNNWEFAWRSFFIIGVVLGPLAVHPLGYYLPKELDMSWEAVIVGAFLVGFGSNMGGGCTSGHGICGAGRFSRRSLWATVIFMIVAMLTVYSFQTISGIR